MSKLARAADLGPLRDATEETLARLVDNGIVARIWNRDHTVWSTAPAGISDKLGWLDCPEAMTRTIGDLESLTTECRREDFTDVLLLGMGGSSLAPEVFRRVFGVASGFLNLTILDSTDPGYIQAQAEGLPLAKTLFLPATKSGGTVETLSLLKFFFNRAKDSVGSSVGRQFVAITDPESDLAELAAELGFRRIQLNDPEIGGRYSALSHFGLLPAALIGLDVARLLESARASLGELRLESADNPAAFLGAAVGAGAQCGRDKLTLVTSPALSPFGVWIEQLVAESTGKNDGGILPIDQEHLRPPDAYREDRIFVYLRLDGENEYDDSVHLLSKEHPVVRIDLSDTYQLGEQFILWELATAILGHLTSINPFDQPNVEAAKEMARSIIVDYREKGELPADEPDLVDGNLLLFGDPASGSLKVTIDRFLEDADGYIALQAYLTPGPQVDDMLTLLRARIAKRTTIATTLGYGPRYLHSTGQLHKGDRGNGRFLQLTRDDPSDLNIPDHAGSPSSSLTFGLLKAAQARGDLQALAESGRVVLRIHLGSDVVGGIERIIDALD